MIAAAAVASGRTPPPPMPFAMICAWLEREFGYRRDQIKDLTRGYVRRVLNWPTDGKGALRRPSAPEPLDTEQAPGADAGGPVLCEEDALARHYFLRGWPAHKIAPKVAEVMAAREKARREQQE